MVNTRCRKSLRNQQIDVSKCGLNRKAGQRVRILFDTRGKQLKFSSIGGTMRIHVVVRHG